MLSKLKYDKQKELDMWAFKEKNKWKAEIQARLSDQARLLFSIAPPKLTISGAGSPEVNGVYEKMSNIPAGFQGEPDIPGTWGMPEPNAATWMIVTGGKPWYSQ